MDVKFNIWHFFQIKSEFADIMRKEIGMTGQEWLRIGSHQPATATLRHGGQRDERPRRAHQRRKSQFQSEFINRPSLLDKLFFTSVNHGETKAEN